MATIANLVVEITSKQSGFEKGLDKATRSVSAFAGNAAKQIARIGAITAGAMTGAAYLINRSFSNAADSVDMLSKAADRLATPLGALQRLDFAASLADVDTDTLVRSMQLMGKNVFEAATQGGEASKVFTRLGINLQDLNRMSADQQFRKIAEALQKVTNAGERNNIQMQIFGRSGIELTNLLNSSLKETDEQFRKLGLGITTSQGKAVEAFNDTKTVIGKIFDGFKEQVAANVAPAFTKINEAVIKSVEDMGGIEKASDAFSLKIIDASLAGINAFGAMSNAATEFGLVLDNIGTKFDVLMAGFSRVGNALSGLSFANKEDTIPLRKSFEVPEGSRARDEIQKIADVAISFTNGVLTATNRWVDVGKNIGEFAFNVTNPGEKQLDKEFNMINPGMEKYKTNQDKAAESIAKTTKATADLTQAVLTARAEFLKGINKGNDKVNKPGGPGFFPEGSSTTPGTSGTGANGPVGTDGKPLPLSLDPAFDALLRKSKDSTAMIMRDYEEAKALRAKFAGTPFGTTGKGLSVDPITHLPIMAPDANKTPTAIVKIILDKDGFFTAIKDSERFGNIVTDVVAAAITDTATMGV